MAGNNGYAPYSGQNNLVDPGNQNPGSRDSSNHDNTDLHGDPVGKNGLNQTSSSLRALESDRQQAAGKGANIQVGGGGTLNTGNIIGSAKALTDKAALDSKERAAEGNKLFNPDGEKPTKGKSKFSLRKKIAVLSISGLGGAGVFFGAGSLGSGPLLIANFAELLEGFHLESKLGQNNSRFLQQARYIKQLAKGTPERSRLNVVTRKFADTYRAKLGAQGIEPINEGKLGYQEGYTIDPEKYGEYKSLPDKSPEAVQKYLQENFNYSTSIQDGKLVTRQGKLFSGRLLMRDTYRLGGFSGGDAILLRFHAKEAGLTLHPIKAIDRTIYRTIDARYTEWKERLKKLIFRKASTPVVTGDPAKDNKGNTGNGADELNNGVTQLEGDANTAGNGVKAGTPGALENFAGSLQLKILAGGAGLAAVVCVIQALFQEADHINELNISNPMQQVASYYMAAGNQAGFGDDNSHNSPVDEEQVGHIAETFFDRTTQTEATSARSIQAELGNNLSGPDLPTSLKTKPSDNYFAQFINGIPFIDKICSAVNSTAGTVVLFGLGAIASPTGTLLYLLVHATGADTALFEDLAGQLAGVTLPPNPKGALLGNIANYGAKKIGDGASQSTAGVYLTKPEGILVAQAEDQYQKQDFDSRSFASRVFDVHDNRTVAAKLMMDTVGPTPDATMSKFATGFLNIGRDTLQSVGSIFTAKISAAPLNSRYDYGGEPDVAHPISEIINPLVADPFTNADAVTGTYDANGQVVPGILDTPDGQEYIKRGQMCFGVTLQQVPDVEHPGSTVWDVKPPSENDDIPSIDTMQKPENKCREDNENWLRVRTFIWDTQIANAQACRQGDNQSCIDSGMLPDPNADTGAGAPTGAGAGLATCTTTAVAAAAAPPGYVLKNCEDFDKGLGQFEPYTGGGDGTVVDGNKSRQPSQCVVTAGILVMSQDAQGTTCGGSMEGFGQKYGYWEVKMRAYSTGGNGSAPHPVLILWPDAEDWDKGGGELDYFETDIPDKMVVYLHCAPNNGQNSSGNCYTNENAVDYRQWHTYGLEWTSNSLSGYIDSVKWYTTGGDGALPPRSMHQTIQLDNLDGTAPVAPGKMEIDWVHMYAK